MVMPPRFPPPLVHELRARSFARLYKMTGSPGNRGFGRVLRSRIQHIAKREHYAVERAITISYLGSYLADHIVFAEKEALRLIEGREMTEREGREIWERNYPNIIARLLAELPDGERVGEELALLDRYTKLPSNLYAFRSRHWHALSRIMRNALDEAVGAVSEIPAVTRVHEVLTSGRPSDRKARNICLAASLLADVESRTAQVPWTEAYQKVMTELYPLLQRYPEVLEAIVHME